MMEITCEGCGKRYRIDETRIPGERARVRCRACGQAIVVRRPAPATAAGDTPGEPALDEVSMTTALEGPPQDAPENDGDTPKVLLERPWAGTEEQAIETERDLTPFVGGRKIRFGLFGKILVVMLIVSLLPFGVFWFITFKETDERIRNSTEQLMAQTAAGVAERVDGWIAGNVAVLRAAAAMPGVRSMLREQQEPILRAVQQQYPWMYLVFTVGTDGMNVARSDDVPLKDYSDRQYYKDIAGGRNLAWQTLIGKTSKKPALVLAVPIREQQRVVGVMAAAMTLEDISEHIAGLKIGATGFAFLLDGEGKVVAHPDRAYVSARKNLSDHPLMQMFRQRRWTNITASFTDTDGRRVLGHARRNPYGWTLALQQDHREVFAAVDKVQRFALTLLACTVLLVVVIAWFSARAIVTPIMKLTDAAERMSLGELNVKIDVKTKDEIGLLAQAVGRMQTSMRLAMSRLRRRR